MLDDCMPFEYGRRDGTILSEEEFYSEHRDIVITPTQKERLTKFRKTVYSGFKGIRKSGLYYITRFL